ncbi:MAG: SPOR domain-containing protein, partial [Rhodobacteraceae bacterium]|nr:SPOR domain-containing protein [Paracoccaceae bacterium]
MADADFDGFEAYEGRGYGRQGSAADRRAPPQETLGARFQALANGAGALTSVALVVGIGIWGYKLAVRDVTGIPVVRALQGPARIAPADPGGDFAGHQGLAVNEIAADGVAPPAPDRLTLAPRAEGLAGEDRPMGELVPTPVPAVARPRTPGIVTPLSDAG